MISITEVVYGWFYVATDCSYVLDLVTTVERTILFDLSIVIAHKAYLVSRSIHEFAFKGHLP